MTIQPVSLSTSDSLAQLASQHAGASRVFQRHGLDFCCHGEVSLSDACRERGLSDDEVLEEIRLEARPDEQVVNWEERPITELVEHILERFHAAHREEVPRLLAMARKVEQVHADKETCPKELAGHLEFMEQELEMHMQKEEQVLFPLIASGRGAMAAMPVQIMEQEHKDHGVNLARLRSLANDFQPPEDACGTWRALYTGLAELESQLMQHIHLENHVLFPRALRRG